MFNFYCRSVQAAMRLGSKIIKTKEPILVKGANSSLGLAKLARENNVSKVLIVTDKGITSLGLMDNMLKAFDEANFPYVVFDETVPNPTLQNIEDALVVYKREKCQGIIAYGGGSAMDCAKVVAARVVKPNTPIVKMKGFFRVLKKIVPLFAIPTTAGTGSETTIAAVISNPETHEKYAIADPCLVPDYAILDPNLTLKLPKHITSTTGMDALTHAVEAFIGQSGTAYTDDCAKKCVKLVFENLYKAYENGENLEARENMQMAAYYGGIAFTRAYVGYIHAIAHTLGGFYRTPHGLANAFILPHVLEYYGECVYDKLAELADLVQVANANDSKEIKAKKFIEAIKELNKSMEIPEFIDVIQDKDIPTMVDRAYNEANPIYPVPKILTKKEIKELYLIISQKK